MFLRCYGVLKPVNHEWLKVYSSWKLELEIWNLGCPATTCQVVDTIYYSRLQSGEFTALRSPPMTTKEEILKGLFQHTLEGHAKAVKGLTEEGLRQRLDPMEMLFDALIPSLEKEY